MNSEDDDDRVLGLEPSDSFASPAERDFVGKSKGDGEEEEGFLDLGSVDSGEGDDDDNNDRDREAVEVGDTHGTGSGNDGNGAEEEGGCTLLSDDELMRISAKSEAKALGRDVYKRWKKLQRQSGKGRSRHSSKKKRSKNKEEDGRSKKERRGKSGGTRTHRKKRRRDDDNEDDDDDDGTGVGSSADVGTTGKRLGKRHRREKPIALGDEELGAAPFADLDDVLQVEEAVAQRNNNAIGTKKRRAGGEYTDVEVRTKKLTVDAHRGILRKMAAAVVSSMREARVKDEVDINQHLPPLHRVGIVDNVVAHCRRDALLAFLIEEGILQELSTWLYDFTRHELAAYELRSAALDILLRFPIDGELGTGVARNGDDILDAFSGMTRDHLIHTYLGSAVNALRQDKKEVHQNRTKAVRLLERLSRAMAGGVKRAHRDGAGASGAAVGGESCGVVTWKCQDDPTVAPPFHVVLTGTEVFQKTLVRPDPLDPLSYLRIPPRRAPKAYVTNLGGNVGGNEK